MSPTPIFRVTVVSRNVQAVNYEHRSGASKLDFAGTDLMPSANGEAKVNSRRGSIEIDAEFGDLQIPTTFGNEYLTYVLWAISPEGRAVNLGEVLVGDNHRSKLRVTTDLQAFALIVTAEPYYAVRQPSNAVVLENVVRESTKGTTEAVNAKYELMERGGYIPTGYRFDPVVLNARLPLEFFEARNALRIAQSEGAEQYASDSYQHAVQLTNNADEFATSRHTDEKGLIAVSRSAVEAAEDSREIAVKKLDEIRLANERQASADTLAISQGQADNAIRQKEQAQSDRGDGSSGQNSGGLGCRQGTRRGCGCTNCNRASQVRYGEQRGYVSRCSLRRPGGCGPVSSSCTASTAGPATSRDRQSGYAREVVRAVEFHS